jgi:hypothetical protein
VGDAAGGIAPRYESYEGPLGRESMLVHGPAAGPRALILLPLFAESNGMRATLVHLARALAAAGIGSAIPDLPGTGESEVALAGVTLADWCAAAAAAGRALGQPHVVALRGGALIDDAVDAASWWRLAPTAGASLLRQLERAQKIADKEAGGGAILPGGGIGGGGEAVIELAGYRVSPLLCEGLRGAEPGTPAGPLRSLPFDGPGLAPWRRAEPTADPELAARLAADIADWIRTCAH